MIRRRTGLWRGLGDYRRRGPIRGSPGVGHCLDSNQVLIGDFPAKVLVLATLFEVLLQEDGAAGICDESSAGGQADIAGSIVNVYFAPEKG
jgi:hypothetical protein